jgi:hypothetical protein
MPLDTVVLTSLAAIWCIRKRSIVVSACAPAVVLIWRLASEWWALNKLDALEHMGESASLIADTPTQRGLVLFAVEAPAVEAPYREGKIERALARV